MQSVKLNNATKLNYLSQGLCDVLEAFLPLCSNEFYIAAFIWQLYIQNQHQVWAMFVIMTLYGESYNLDIKRVEQKVTLHE